MKNKILLCACALALFSLAGCHKNDTDLLAIDSQLAQKNLLGIYVYVDVDSVNMCTTLHEWKLVNDTNGRVGYYRLAATGNGKDLDETTPLTWSEAKMADDHLSMTIPITIGGVNKELIWKNGVIETDGYATTKFEISEAAVLRKLHDSFKNLKFVVNDTTPALFYDKKMIKYLVWNTEQRKNVTVDSVNHYNEYLATMKDTIAWYNAKFGKNIPDTVKGTPNAQGIYKVAIFPVSTEIKEVVTDTINYGPAQVITGEMEFNVVGGVYQGSYSLRFENWSLDYYMDPLESTATWSDTTYTISNAIWTPSYYINGVTFSVLFKGHETIQSKASVAGVQTKDFASDKANAYHVVSLSQYDTFDSIPTIKVGEVQFKLEK